MKTAAARIRSAFRALAGHADTDLFNKGLKVGQHIAYQTYEQYGIVIDPYADAEPAPVRPHLTLVGGAR